MAFRVPDFSTLGANMLAAASEAAAKTLLSLNNCDNTSDVNKPVSTAQAAADALRLLLTGGTMTGLLRLTGTGNLFGIGPQSPNYRMQIFANSETSAWMGIGLEPTLSTGNGWNVFNGNGGSGFVLQGTASGKSYASTQVRCGADGSLAFTTGDGNGAAVEAARIAVTTRNLQLAYGLDVPKTITAPGTTGGQVINKMAGRVNFAASATSLVVTNSLVTADSVVLCIAAGADASFRLSNVVATAGSFTINAGVAPTAETPVNFLVIN